MRDPLTLTRDRLANEYSVADEKLDEIVKSVERKIETVRQRALEAPFRESAIGAEFGS